MGWCSSIPEHTRRLPLDSVPLMLIFYVVPSVMMWSLLFPSLQDSSGFLAPSGTSCLSPLSFLPICPLSAHFCVFRQLSSSVWSPQSSVPHRPSAGELPTLRLWPTNGLFWFPNPASHMQVCTPPLPIRLVVLGLGVGGGEKETEPPAVVLSPSSRRQASPASGQVHAYARHSISLLILAVPTWS